jgi:signal transduction histidine kinase
MSNDSREALLEREIARLVHDLRNPLNAFATSVALLDATLPEEPGLTRRTLGCMGNAVEEMQRVIAELAAVALGEGVR